MADGTTRRVKSKVVCTTAPAHRLVQVEGVADLVPEAAKLSQVYYPPVASVTLAYPKKAFRRELRGFGHLIPRKMKVRVFVYCSCIRCHP